MLSKLFSGSTEKELRETPDTFSSEYTNSNQKNDPFERNEFICNIKYINDGNSHL